MRADVVAIGEGLFRMSPVGANRFSETDLVRTYVGGAEVNTLVGLASLGRRALWLSRVTKNLLGDRLVDEVAKHGVDVGSVARTPAGRVGCYWLEQGRAPRNERITYDRSGSAMAHLKPSDLPLHIFDAERAILHTTGITLALSDETRSTVLGAIRRARQAGWTITFDTNHRLQLWDVELARATYLDVLPLADIVFVPARDLALLLEGADAGSIDRAMRVLATRYPGRTLVVTDGANGVHASTCGGEMLEQAAIAATPVDRIGRGDAFVAGFLHAVLGTGLEPAGVERALRWGAAMAALKYATPGDLPLVDLHDLEALVGEAVGSDAAP